MTEELRPEHVDQSWTNEEAKAAGFKKLTPAGANVVMRNTHLYLARQMQNPQVMSDGVRLMDIWSEEERRRFASEHPDAWAQAASERADEEGEV